MSYKRVSLLVPTRKRPERLKTFLDSYYATSGDSSEIVFRVDHDDLESVRLLSEHRWPIVVGPRHRGYASLPLFYNDMARLASGDILVCCNDDAIIETPGWAALIIEAANRYPDGIFNIGVSTIMHEDSYIFSCVSRKFVDRLGFINDERLLFSDIFLKDVAQHFGRLIKLWSVVFRHDWAGTAADVTAREAQAHHMNIVFADTLGNWTDSYRLLHDSVVAEAVAKIDPGGEFLANQALLDYERYDPPPVPEGAYWPPSGPPLPWSAARDHWQGIHYQRDEIFELFKAIASSALPRGRVVLTSRNSGLPAILWGCLYDHVVTLVDAKASEPIEDTKYRVEFGSVCNAHFMHELIGRIGQVDAVVLDSVLYPRLISPYFTFRHAMPRPSLIVLMNTGIGADGAKNAHARRFVDDLSEGRLDGIYHRFAHIDLPDGSGISYEVLE